MNNPKQKNKRIQHIYPPPDGWLPQTLYLVEVKFFANNPVHRSTFYTGFLDNGKPCGYNDLHNPGMCESNQIEDVFYLRAIRVLATKEELSKFPQEPTLQ